MGGFSDARARAETPVQPQPCPAAVEAPPVTLSVDERAALVHGLRAKRDEIKRQRIDPLEGARMLRDCELKHGGVRPDGSRMTQFQREFWRTALKAEPEPAPEDSSW